MDALRNLVRQNSRAVSMLVIVAVTAYAFWPALQNGFVNWDDPGNFTDNPNYRGLGWAQLKWMFTSFHMGVYIPLTWISLAIDYLLWGLNPGGYHLTSLLLHAVNGVLVYLIAKDLIEREGREAAAASMGALFGALFFSVHPLRVESVAWATERRDVLCGFFFLLSVLFYVKSESSGRGRLRVGSWIAYLLSLLSKAASIPLPGLLIVLDLYLAKKRHPERRFLALDEITRSVVDKLPYLALAIPFSLFALFGQSRHSIMASAKSFGVVERVAVASYAGVFYVAKTIWPARLSPLYSLPLRFDPLELRFVVCVLLVTLATAAALRYADRWPALAAAWGWYLVAFLPTSGIFQAGFQIAADRYSYLPCLAWALVAGGLASRIPQRVATRLGLAFVILVLVILTRAQTAIWRDTFTLWEYVVAVEPESITGHNNLGAALAEAGRFDEAIPHLRFVLERNPEHASARHNLETALDSAKTDGAPRFP